MSVQAELLNEFFELISTGLNECKNQQTEKTASIITEKIRKEFGGTLLYIPKDTDRNLTTRNKLIQAQFNGSNHLELATKYGLTIQRIYKVLKKKG